MNSGSNNAPDTLIEKPDKTVFWGKGFGGEALQTLIPLRQPACTST